MQVRKAQLSDLETLLDFEQQIIKTERRFDPTLRAEKFYYYDLEEMISSPDAEIAIAESDGRIIASGSAIIKTAEKSYYSFERYAYLGFMYVVPEFRGRGVNRLIMEELCNWATAKGLTEIRLKVYAENQPAILAYEKAGFEKGLIEMRMRMEKG